MKRRGSWERRFTTFATGARNFCDLPASFAGLCKKRNTPTSTVIKISPADGTSSPARGSADQRQRPVRVLEITDTLGMGGAETWLMELLRLWSNTGAVQMDFLLTSGNRGIFDDEACRLGARLHYVRYGRVKSCPICQGISPDPA